MMVYRKIFIVVSLFFYTVNYAADMVTKQRLRRLNILFVVGHFPSPSQIFVLNIITGLIDRGHSVSIFSFHKDNYSAVHPNVIKYKLLDRTTYEEFPKVLPEYDIVFCQFGYLGIKLLGIKHLAKWLRKRMLVVCFRGSDTTKYVKDSPAAVYEKLFKQGGLFLPVCDYLKNRLIALGCDPNKIIVHHSAIDCSKFFFTQRKKPEKNTIHLISVCRLVKKKGIDYAIKAIAQVVQKYPRIHYSVVGDGPERNYLELLIKQLKLQDKVTLHGWKTQEQVIALLNRSHIFLLPSRIGSDGNEEGIANALKEAMAMGLISIATWHAGTPELITDGVSGFLVPEKSVVQLAKDIMYVIEHPEKWESIGLAARKKIEDEFETTQSIQILEKLFYALLGRSKAENFV